MNKIKYLVLLIIVFLFSGCSVVYNLDIDNDLSITESVQASEKEDDLKAITGMDTKKAVNYLYDIFKRDKDEPSMSTSITDGVLTTYLSLSHNSIDDYADSFTSDIFNEVNMSKKDDIISLTFNQNEQILSKSSSTLVYDDVTMNITVPYKVIDNNADSIDGNTYTWKFEKDEELRKIKISFDTSKTKKTRSFTLGFLNININYNVLFFTGLIIIVGTAVLIIYINNKKNNKI